MRVPLSDPLNGLAQEALEAVGRALGGVAESRHHLIEEREEFVRGDGGEGGLQVRVDEGVRHVVEPQRHKAEDRAHIVPK